MHMFNNPVMSDIKFVFPDHDKQSIPAHKYVLATSSPVFFAMFYGELCFAGVSVAHRGKILRTAKNHKFIEKRWLRDRAKVDVFFNRPVVLSEDTCYTIETSTNSI